jgi:hypothetical protein
MSFNPAEMLVPGTIPMSEPNIAIYIIRMRGFVCNKNLEIKGLEDETYSFMSDYWRSHLRK